MKPPAQPPVLCNPFIGSKSRIHPVAFCLLAAILPVVLVATSQAQTLSSLWFIAPGAAGFDLAVTNNQQRGLAYNPATSNVVYVSRTAATAGIKVKRVSAETGTLISPDIDSDAAVITGGLATLGTIICSDDGVLYACNISGSGTAAPSFKLYRWTNENSAPLLVYQGDLDGTIARVGDAMAIRSIGVGTTILVGSDQQTVAFLTTTDANGAFGTWTAKKLSVTGGGASYYKSGLAFGPGDTFFAKDNTRPLVRVSFDLVGGTAAVATTYATTLFTGAMVGIAYDPVNQLLMTATRNSTANSFQTNLLFDFYNLSNPTQVDKKTFPSNVADGATGVSWTAFGGGKAFGSVQNNGIVAYTVVISTNRPAFLANPADTAIVQGGYGSLRANVSGRQPITFQWLFADTNLVNATNVDLNLTNVTPAQAGAYQVVAANSYGSSTSGVATLTVTPTALSDVLTPLWSKAPGSAFYLANDNNQRGIAYRAQSDRLIVVSRTPTNGVHVLNAANGDYLYTLKMSSATVTISGGTLPVNMVGVDDDGFIYVCNLTTAGDTTAFKVYRWLEDAPDVEPELAWSGNPAPGTSQRWGDNFAVRGLNSDPHLLVASRSSNIVSILRPGFGPDAAPNVFYTDGTAGNYGLSVAYGLGDVFWGKASGQSLREVSFNLNTSASATLHNYNTYPAMSVVGVAPSLALLAGVSDEIPNSLRLYDLSNLETRGLVNIDTEFFPTDNANANRTGAVSFGNNRVFAIDSNNGIIALQIDPSKIPPVLSYLRTGSSLTLTWIGAAVLQSKSAVTGPWVDLIAATSGFTTNLPAGGEIFFQLRK